MCGRAALTSRTLEELADALDAEPVASGLYRPRYNIAPSDQVWIVVAQAGRRALIPAVWGLPSPDGRSRRPIINVRSESVSVRSGSSSGGPFASLFRESRCAFVCTGFYEWNAGRQPHLFRPANDELLLLGALALPRGSAELPATAVLTTKPNELVAAVHGRMPVLIPKQCLGAWLGDGPLNLGSWLVPPAPASASTPTVALSRVRVSRRVGNVRHDDPDCLRALSDEEPDEDAPAPSVEKASAGQLKLFG